MAEKSEKNKKEKDFQSENVRELQEVMKALNENLPPLVNSLLGPILELVKSSEQNTVERGKSIAAVYRELKAAGMSDEMIMKVLDEQFPSVLKVIGDLLSSLASGKGDSGYSWWYSGGDMGGAVKKGVSEGNEGSKEGVVREKREAGKTGELGQKGARAPQQGEGTHGSPRIMPG